MRTTLPPLKYHAHSRQWRAYIGGRYRYFGKDRQTAEREYLLALAKRNDDTGTITVAHVVRRICEWAATEYKPHGRWGGESKTIRYALAFLDCRVTIQTPDGAESNVYLPVVPADDFTVVHLSAVQRRMIELGKSRTYINGCIKRIVRAWEQARVLGMVSRETVADLRTIRNIRQGHPTVHETGRVMSVDDATVNATLPHLSPMIADIVRVLRLSGMRVGELVKMRLDMLDTSGEHWLYHLGTDHKTGRRKHDKTIRLRPEIQAVLKPWVQAARATMNTRAQVWPSTLNPTGRIMEHSIRRAITTACEKAGIKPKWTTHQLRHARATEIAQAEVAALAKVKAELGQTSNAAARAYVDPGTAG